jgi:streptogramin lyase
LHGDRVYYGSSDTYQIEVYASAGVLERIVRLAIPNPPLTSDEIRAYEDERRENLTRTSPQFRELYQSVELPDTKPAHGELLVDATGNLWVAEYRRRREDQSIWRVFDPTGQYLGVVETPEGGRIFQIGDDYLLGMWRDDLDVEQVRLFTVEKPDAGSREL